MAENTETPPTVPNPGSPEAVDLGCSCGVLDNGHGRGYLGDGEKYGWWLSEDCPLHGEAATAMMALRSLAKSQAEAAEEEGESDGHV